MRLPSWMREALDGYKWLWDAQLRWGTGPRWWAGLHFACRVAADVARAVLTLLPPAATSVGAHDDRRNTMTLPHAVAVPATPDATANQRLKSSFGSWMWTSMILAVVVHFAVFAFWPEMTAADTSTPTKELTVLDATPEVDIPDRPEDPIRPAAPVVAVGAPDDLTIPSTDWEENPVSDLPPPPTAVESAGSRASGFTPFTLEPRILNAADVVRAMRREYPTVLRDAGIGGTVRVNFFVDEDGGILDTRVEESSGYAALDDAALTVAGVIRFSPAMNRDRRVAVRVTFPIVFQVEDRE